MNAKQQITYIGHATLLLEMNGVRLFTDPILRNRVFHLVRRSQPVDPLLYQDIDAVLISHLHWDHLDIPSLQMLGRDIHLIVPAGSRNLLYKRGYRNIEEMQPGDTTDVNGLCIQATYAEHHGSFFPNGPYDNCLGFLVKGAHTVYFAGDTDLFPGMADLSENLDVALLPVWGWGPNLGSGHMSPYRAAQALKLLHPRIAIPIHWGTFYPRWLNWVRPSLMTDPPQIFLREAQLNTPQIKIQILAPGRSLLLPLLA